MFLRRLELVGFKSFAPKSSTEFVAGISAVVGPNGSGKSNIADAILWVLGEQSARAVRARKPEEVIFAGSASRQPLGMAEVSLVLDNADSSLPIEYAEVRITRRLYRSGDSEYLLNGSRVRLRDITQLLLHAGLSPDSYSVIGQGSIDELILQRPEERRIAFESAADIRRHQLKLQDTRSKLASTQANLVRVNDILAELAPHVRRLKGQADRAARVEAVRTELHELLARWFRARLARAAADRNAANLELAEASHAADAAEAESRAAQAAFANIDQAMAELEDGLAVLRPRADSFREQARAAERTLAVTRERAAGLDQQRANLGADLQRLEQQLQLLERERAMHMNDGDADGDEADSEDLVAARRQLEEREATYAAAQNERARLMRDRDRAEAQIIDAEARLARTEGRARRLEADLAVDEARKLDREQRLSQLDQQVTSLGEERARISETVAEARQALQNAVAARAAVAEELEFRQAALRKLEQHADRLRGALQALGASRIRQPDTDAMPASWQSTLADLPVVGLADDLASHVLPIDALLRGYLHRIVVLRGDDGAREAHRRLSRALPEAEPAWAVLSMDGLLVTPAGERRMASATNDGTALADWRRQVEQLEAELAQLEKERAVVDADLGGARLELDAATRQEEAARATTGELDARAEQVRLAELGAVQDLRRLREEHQRSASEAVQRLQERSRAMTQARDTRQSVSAAREARDNATTAVREAEQRVAQLEAELRTARTELLTAERSQAQRKAERDARASLRARIAADLDATQGQRDAAAARVDELTAQGTQLEDRASRLERDVHDTLASLEPIEHELAAAEQRRGGLLAERRALEQRLAELRDTERRAHTVREERHVRAQRAADDMERLQAEIAETAELEQVQLSLLLDGETPESDETLAALHRRITSLQRELRTVGVVAESVVDEFRELSERHEFLTRQSEDLRTAMADLQEAAVELEAHMRERFVDVFEAVQVAFQDCFKVLFGGGEARLVLTEPDDLLRTGVDIVARPPGKKLQGLVSMSGGERALTAVALLFGLLRVHPTPFCVLDEVDAALDEANVQRFANLLADFARRIQFIVVTHNRATMDKADALYGVSMDVDGISHVFSVRPTAVAS